jgi:hypothetical protein
MCLSLASPPNRILARPDVRTTLSKKFNGRNQRPMSNLTANVAGEHRCQVRCARAVNKFLRCSRYQRDIPENSTPSLPLVFPELCGSCVY